MFDLVTRIVSALALTFNLAAYGFGLIPAPVLQPEKTQVPETTAPSTSVYDDMLDNLDHSSLSFEAVISRDGDDLSEEMPGEPYSQDSRVAKATSAPSEPSILETKPEYEWIEFKITHYTKDEPGMNGKGITSTGTKVKAGRTIAVDPKVIPYGTRVYIEGIGYRVAEDCGGAVKGNHVDVYVDRSDGEHLLNVTLKAKLRIVK